MSALIRSHDLCLILANKNRGFRRGYNLCIWDAMDKVISFADQANGVSFHSIFSRLWCHVKMYIIYHMRWSLTVVIFNYNNLIDFWVMNFPVY
jgi:hypothetical protein